MPLYGQFKDEADFRDRFIRPLLNRLGFYGVSEQHGTQEFGKDFVFSELHRLGGMRHYAAQVKHEETINQGKAVDELLTQARQAFAKPFTRPDSPRACYVSAVYIFNSGEIATNAKEQLAAYLEREHFGDNVIFLAGERLVALNEFATLQTDANVRARLVGLRVALQFIVIDLTTHYLEAKTSLVPLFTHSVELSLSEPVIIDTEFLRQLFRLWINLQALESLRANYVYRPKDGDAFKEIAPKIIELAKEALLQIKEIQKAVDAAIIRLEPLK